MTPRLDIHFTLEQQCSFFLGTSYHPKEREFLLNHARSGILMAIQSLHLPVGSKVGVMAYNCRTVFNAVAQAGCQLVFIDVTERLSIDLEDLKRKASLLKALVVTHLFGIQNDIHSIRSSFPNLPIIEDCAHAYGIIEGTAGDFSVFSVGQGKLPSIGDGGILRVNNKAFLEEIKRLYEPIPKYSILAELKLFGKLWIKAFSYLPVVYSLFTEPIKSRRSIPVGIDRIHLRKMSRGIQRLYQKEKRQTQAQFSIEKRLKRAGFLIESFHMKDVLFFYGANAFMLIALCEDPIPVKAFYKGFGLETATHFAHCIDWASCFGYQIGGCPNTEYLIKHLLMIPTYQK